ncbi:MAG: YdeI/OmpD-associated family protein [Acidobacteria bacterium]|nr:YdeI/OmpD-associated family protein [Acidobacteriota bacterium]
MAALDTLEFRTRKQWRRWLGTHHGTSPGVWVVFRKGAAASRGVGYEEAVREALCFGWIDSLVKRLDEERYARKFTPRKPGSAWSDSNRRRWAELNTAGLLAPAGRTAAPTARSSTPPPVPDLPDELARALKRHPAAERTFEGLAPSHRRHYAAWIHTAKRAETRERRVREAIALLAAGRKLGLK